MDYGVALIALASTVIATLLTLLPGLTSDDRARERIMRDIKLLKALPEGFDQHPLKENIEESIAKMLSERARREHERLWTWATGAMVVAVVIMVIMAVLPNDHEVWTVINLYLSITLGIVFFFAIGVPIAGFIRFRRKKYAKTDTLEQESQSPKS